jgi:hypothetical protein
MSVQEWAPSGRSRAEGLCSVGIWSERVEAWGAAGRTTWTPVVGLADETSERGRLCGISLVRSSRRQPSTTECPGGDDLPQGGVVTSVILSGAEQTEERTLEIVNVGTKMTGGSKLFRRKFTQALTLTPYSQGTFETNRYSVPVKRARREVTLKAYPFTVEIWDGMELLASHPRCYERYQNILDPLHYLPLLEQRPGAFDFSKPMRQWKRNWPAAYDEMLSDLRQKWPNGRGVQEFVKILELHQTYSAEVMRQAIEQALQLRCVHFDGVVYCIHEIEGKARTLDAPPPQNLDLSHRPDLDAVGKNQRVNLAQYDQLLKQSW